MVDTTYRVISNKVLENIKSRCVNIRNYSSIPSELKPNYQWDQRRSRGRFRWKIDSTTVITQETDENLESNYNQFMTEYGVKLDEKVTTNGLLHFFTALSIWCASHVIICSSQLKNDRIICFRGGNTDLSTPTPINKNLLIRATDVLTLIQIANEITSNNIKNYFIRYTEDLTDV